MPADDLAVELVEPAPPLPRGHRPAQLVGLGPGEPGGDDREPHRLLLEQRDAQRLLEHAPQLVLLVGDRVRPDAAGGAGTGGPSPPGSARGGRSPPRSRGRRSPAASEPREHRHLRPALDLEDADRVGPAEHVVHGRVLAAGSCAAARAGSAGTIASPLDRQVSMPSAEEVDLEEPEHVEVVLVPLDDRPAGHGRVGDRDQVARPATGSMTMPPTCWLRWRGKPISPRGQREQLPAPSGRPGRRRPPGPGRRSPSPCATSPVGGPGRRPGPGPRPSALPTSRTADRHR